MPVSDKVRTLHLHGDILAQESLRRTHSTGLTAQDSLHRPVMALMQEQRKLDMQQAAEAEAASKARASLLRKNLQKANRKVLLEAERLKAEGKATRAAAGQALLAAVRCQLPPGESHTDGATDSSGVTCTEERGLSSRLSDMLTSQTEEMAPQETLRQQDHKCLQHRLTADYVLMRQERGTHPSVSKVLL